MTLQEARAMVFANLAEGMDCPCCDQKAKRYKRKLNRTMVLWLAALSRVRDSSRAPAWAHVDDLPPQKGGEHAKLAHWGLAELRTNEDDDKRTSGFWRITNLGIQFIAGVVDVPTHVYLYNNTIVGWSDERFFVGDACDVVFNWPEIKGASYLPAERAPWIPPPAPEADARQLALL